MRLSVRCSTLTNMQTYWNLGMIGRECNFAPALVLAAERHSTDEARPP